MFELARNTLFRFEPETAHNISVKTLGVAGALGLTKLCMPEPIAAPVNVMGLTFPNAVGMAAGFDKNAECFTGLGHLGFGFVEVGTVTPKPQPGNEKPRLFRLTEQQAIINRMGFNNHGLDALVKRISNRRFPGILGVNIGKNVFTPIERAVDDYINCLDAVHAYADYVVVNISSPNTPGLRELQYGDYLRDLLAAIKERQERLNLTNRRSVPISVKIAPDMNDAELASFAKIMLESGLDAVTATNTTLSREGVEGSQYADEAGGLSGAPLRDTSTQVIRALAAQLKHRLPIIGVGGIYSGQDALEKIQAGASLVQLYSGFIYYGPRLVREVAQTLASNVSVRKPSNFF